MFDFVRWPKIPRFNREWEITEKIDGTNGILLWSAEYHPEWCLGTGVMADEPDQMYLYAGSRTRWLTRQADNHGFANWASDYAPALATLGKGRHFGEWWGPGIQRRYGLAEKRFSLFDVNKYNDLPMPANVTTVPLIARVSAPGLDYKLEGILNDLRSTGSFAAPGFMNPEGIVMRHSQSGERFKVLLEGDEAPKSVNMLGVGNV